MPFNVNPPCPSEQKTLISWQFPGQAQKSSNTGDDYQVYYGFDANSPRVSVNIGWNATLNSSASPNCSSPDYSVEPNHPSVPFFRVKKLPLDPKSLFIVTPFYNTVTGQLLSDRTEGWKVDVETYTGNTGSTSSVTTRFAKAPDNACLFIPSSLRNVVYFFNFPSAVKYVIDIYKDGKVIASDAGSSSPMVVYECVGAACPPDTCEVDCGTHVCCYNSQGIPVSSYLK